MGGPDPCLTQAADVSYYVPITFSAATLKSGSGFYGYGRNCNKWIVDVSLQHLSNSNPDSKGVTTWNGETDYLSGAYDLPSSAVVNGSVPSNQQDCGRFAQTETLYEALEVAPGVHPSYTLVAVRDWGAQWSNGVCNFDPYPTYTYGTLPQWMNAPQGGGGLNLNYYRFAITVKQRTSFQEAAFFLSEPPPV